MVGNAGHRRTAYVQDALMRSGHSAARFVAWLDVLEGRVVLPDLLDDDTILRLESPGEDARVTRRLLARGAEELDEPTLTAQEALCAPLEHGRLLAPGQLRAGWQAVLRDLQVILEGAPGRIMSRPDEIAVMFDKLATHRRLDAHGVPRMPSLEGVGSWEALRARMDEAGWDRVFVKLRGSSSASGVAALRVSGPRAMLTTTAHLVEDSDGRFSIYNSLRPRRYHDIRQIALLLNYLLAEGAVVEKWSSKAMIRHDGQDKNFDLRVVVIGGEARQVVVRASEHPMTNLHLGNARGELDQVRALVGDVGWSALEVLCRQAAQAFPGAYYLGADVLFPADALDAPRIIEVNAFGDLLPNVYDRGEDSYTAEVRGFAGWGRLEAWPKIRAVLFDLDNTLIDRDAAFCAAVRRWTGCDDEALARVFALDAHGHGDRRVLCEALCGLLGREAGEWRAVWAELPRRIAAELVPEPAIQAMLERLSKRYKLALLSNGGSASQRDKLARADLLRHFDPDAIFISDEIGATKPDAAIFEAALSATGCAEDPRAAVMVGDTPVHDLLGARCVGLRTAWVVRGRTWHVAQPAPEVELGEVTELEAWLMREDER